MKRLAPATLFLLAGALFTGAVAGGAEPGKAERAYPLWDGQESVADYARRTGLEPTKTLNLGNGVTMEFVLIPAGKFIMGTPEPEPVNEEGLGQRIILGQFTVIGAGAVLLVLTGVVVIRAIRDRHRPRYSLARFIAMIMILGAGVCGGTVWYTTAGELARERVEYAAAEARCAAADNCERPAHEVTITRPFYLGKYEVTQEQYVAVVRRNPSWFFGSGPNALRRAVDAVDDPQEFCRRASEGSGATLRLPTEAEWEYACRAGTKTQYHSGDQDADLDAVAWHKRNSNETTNPVGQKTPNAWGLYDMHGNVWEWCQDRFGEYSLGTVQDPAGPTSSRFRVQRGGAWDSEPRYCRSAYRRMSGPGSRYILGDGLRVVLAALQ